MDQVQGVDPVSSPRHIETHRAREHNEGIETTTFGFYIQCFHSTKRTYSSAGWNTGISHGHGRVANGS